MKTSQRTGEKWSKDKMRGEKRLGEVEGKEKNDKVLEEQSRDQMREQWRCGDNIRLVDIFVDYIIRKD